MTKEQEALKLALEALNAMNPYPASKEEQRSAAITAIKEALAQPEQEPVAWANQVVGGRKWLSIHASKGASDRWLEYRLKEQAQGEQYKQVALYTTPPQRKPLTDEEIILIVAECAASHQHTDIHFARAIERAHGIKELV